MASTTDISDAVRRRGNRTSTAGSSAKAMPVSTMRSRFRGVRIATASQLGLGDPTDDLELLATPATRWGTDTAHGAQILCEDRVTRIAGRSVSYTHLRAHETVLDL